jgi:hypothetical protein
VNGRLKAILSTPLVLGALTVGLVGMQTAPATAASAGAATVQGAGTISPALSATGLPASHSFTFTSTTITITGVVNGAPVVASPSSCSASGASISEIYAGGAGTGGWSCGSGVLAGRSGSLAYVRVGAVVPVAITGGLDGALGCVFLANQTPPSDISSYGLTCAGAGVSAT